MISLFTNLEVGRSSLQAQQAGLQIVGNNIANVNTPGYHRQRAVLQESLAEWTPAGEIGRGVTIARVESVRDQFLELRISQSMQNSGKLSTTAGYLGQIEAVFGPDSSGIQESVTRFFNSFSALSDDVGSSSLRYGVISAAESVAASFRGTAAQLSEARDNANAVVADSVRRINDLSGQIARLNQQIAGGELGGVEASSLRDQRSEAVNQLASIIDIQYHFEGDSGGITISTSGTPLVTAGFASQLAAAPGSNGYFSVVSGGLDITSKIQGGSLGGALDVRDRIIPGYQNDLDTLAESIITQINAAHRAGTDLKVPPTAPGLDLFVPAATVAGAAAGFAVNSVVAGDPQYIAAGLSGAPGDNANALAIADMASAKLFAGGTQSFAEGFAALQFKVGIDQQSTSAALDTEKALSTQLSNSRDSISGVSIDEEAVDLIRFQRAYQASARFISVIDQLTADLINAFSS